MPIQTKTILKLDRQQIEDEPLPIMKGTVDIVLVPMELKGKPLPKSFLESLGYLIHINSILAYYE